MSDQATLSDGYRVLAALDRADVRRSFAAEVLAGLSESPKRLSSRWFYDDEGSALFGKICDQPEYYPTRCEQQILAAHREDLRALAMDGARPLNVVDLGAGDGRKTRVLLDHLLGAGAAVHYVPIDISEGAMRELVARMRTTLPTLEVHGLVAEYVAGLSWLKDQRPQRRNLVLFLGSSAGNFRRGPLRALLWQLREACSHGDLLLVGFDLKKELPAMVAAYTDRAGMTAAFNTNLLRRINAELGGEFQLERFRHYATYNVASGAIESYLISLQAQSVHVAALDARFDFREWEPIHLEFSYKFLESEVQALAAEAGFLVERHLFDAQRWFLDALWRVDKPDG